MRAALAPGLSAAVAEQVRHQLAVLDLQTAGVLRRPVEVKLVRTQLHDLIRAWRRLLETHHPADGQLRCPRCRSWWGRRRRWPCGVWRIAHTSLVACQEPAPDAARAALAWVRQSRPAGPLGAWPIPAGHRSAPGTNAHPLSDAAGSPGVVVLERSTAAVPDPVGALSGAGTGQATTRQGS